MNTCRKNCWQQRRTWHRKGWWRRRAILRALPKGWSAGCRIPRDEREGTRRVARETRVREGVKAVFTTENTEDTEKRSAKAKSKGSRGLHGLARIIPLVHLHGPVQRVDLFAASPGLKPAKSGTFCHHASEPVTKPSSRWSGSRRFGVSDNLQSRFALRFFVSGGKGNA